jgi:AcrR family transcriptional regulator
MTTSTNPDITTDTRERILREAEQLFAEQDFSGSSMAEIAQRAGIAKSVIYHHFKGKDDILATLLDGFIDEAVELNRQLPEKHGISTDDPLSASIDVVEACMREMIDFMGTRKWMLKIILLQSVKKCCDVPLFDIVGKFQQGTDECCSTAREKIEGKLADIQVADFFMNFMPIISFLVFQDRWCEHSGIDEETAKRKFIDAYVGYTRKVYWPMVTEAS